MSHYTSIFNSIKDKLINKSICKEVLIYNSQLDNNFSEENVTLFPSVLVEFSNTQYNTISNQFQITDTIRLHVIDENLDSQSTDFYTIVDNVRNNIHKLYIDALKSQLFIQNAYANVNQTNIYSHILEFECISKVSLIDENEEEVDITTVELNFDLIIDNEVIRTGILDSSSSTSGNTVSFTSNSTSGSTYATIQYVDSKFNASTSFAESLIANITVKDYSTAGLASTSFAESLVSSISVPSVSIIEEFNSGYQIGLLNWYWNFSDTDKIFQLAYLNGAGLKLGTNTSAYNSAFLEGSQDILTPAKTDSVSWIIKLNQLTDFHTKFYITQSNKRVGFQIVNSTVTGYWQEEDATEHNETISFSPTTTDFIKLAIRNLGYGWEYYVQGQSKAAMYNTLFTSTTSYRSNIGIYKDTADSTQKSIEIRKITFKTSGT